MPSLTQTNAWSFASLKSATPVTPQAPAKADAAADSGWDFTFHNLLSIVNPLQHLPVIGTLYRAITGDKIATPEKIAGDALYGGLWGAVSSIADTAFEAVTGKDFGDTVLALFTGSSDKPAAAVAAASPATASTPTPLPASADILALTDALARKGVDSDIAQRALSAYRRSVTPQGTLLAIAQ
jgi:hypothetical protein